LELTLHLEEYDADPARFAELHYPSTGGPDSYPVQNNIRRSREDLERRPARLVVHFAELATTEAELSATELQVLEELAAMRRDTSGRVPWPDGPRALAILREESVAWVRKNHAASLKWLRRQELRDLEYRKRRLERAAAFEQETERILRDSLAGMPAEKAAIYRAFYDSMTQVMTTGQFGAGEIHALAAGKTEALRPILDATMHKLASTREDAGGGASEA
jgi:hypothetical protein